MLRWGMLLAAGVCWAQAGPDAGVGRGMFRIYCAACHGIRAQGGRGPDLTRGVFASGDRDEDLAHTISNGVSGTEMSGFGEALGQENIRRLIAFIRSVGRQDSGPVPGNAARGSELFWDKGNCGQCHRVGERGGSFGPELTRAGRQRSLEYLRESVVTPGADITPGYATVRVVTRDGKTIAGIEKGFDNFTAQLMDLGGKFHSFDKSEVRSAKRETTSLMPEDYGKRFSPGELTDLIAYLASLRGEAKP